MKIALRKLSICLSLITFIICLWLCWKHNTFDTEMKTTISGISMGNGPTTYGFLADCYFFVACFLLTFIIGILIQQKIASFTIATSSLCLIIFQFWKINEWYLLIIGQFSYYNTESFFDLLRHSVPFIWLCFSIIIVLMIIQIIDFFKPLIKSE